MSASEDSDEEAKGKGDEKKFVNKGTLSKSKLENKRHQKEAVKRIKTKRQKGTTASVHPTEKKAGTPKI